MWAGWGKGEEGIGAFLCQFKLTELCIKTYIVLSLVANAVEEPDLSGSDWYIVMRHMKSSIVVLLVMFLCMSSAFAQDTTYVPHYDAPDGEEIVLIYIGAYNCGPCHSPEIKNALSRLKILLKERINARGQDFATMGIALDWKVDVGYGYLSEVGPWDEIIVGKNWTNLGASTFIWKEADTLAAMPQIVIARRDVDFGDQGAWVSDYEVVAHHMNIVEWYEQGAPLELN